MLSPSPPRPPTVSTLSMPRPRLQPTTTWRTVKNVRRVHLVLAFVTALAILLATAATALPSAFLPPNLFRHRSQPSRPSGPMPIYVKHLPGLPSHLHLRRPHDPIIRRQQSTSSLSPSSSSTPTPTLSSIATPPAIPTRQPPLPTPFPQPFDETLSGVEFVSASCQKFFTAFTNDISFRSCRAFSFLYAASEDFLNMLGPEAIGFANVTDPLEALTDVIWGICNTTTAQETCASRMSDYEDQLQRVCSAELSQEEPLAVTALHAFRNFNLMRTAVCLANQRTNSYCFVDAVAAAYNGSPSDIYFYQLPLGTPLPGTGTEKGIKLSVTCSTCVRSLMGVYLQYLPSANGGGGLDNGTDLLIQHTYHDASEFVAKQCGSGYASAVSVSSAAAPARIPLLPCIIIIIGIVLGAW